MSETTTTEPTQDQRDVIMHSLGLPNRDRRKTIPYRNYYCTSVGDPKLEAIVAAGWMRKGCTLNEGRDRYYIVTEAGAKAVGARLPKAESTRA